MTKQELLKFICDMYGIDECNSMILKQINKYVTEHRCDYIDIARALSYFVDVEGGMPDIKFGIGIVESRLEISKKYFEKLRREKEERLRAAERLKKNSANTKVIQCKMPQKNKNKKRIKIEELR